MSTNNTKADGKEISVKVFICHCGKARMKSVIIPDGTLSKEQKKEHAELLHAGLDVKTLPFDEAREMDMCFTCKL